MERYGREKVKVYKAIFKNMFFAVTTHKEETAMVNKFIVFCHIIGNFCFLEYKSITLLVSVDYFTNFQLFLIGLFRIFG